MSTGLSCCCYDYGCIDDSVGFFPYEPDPVTGIGLDRYQQPCATPCADINGQPIGFAASNFSYKFDCCSLNDPTGIDLSTCCTYPAIITGCTDPLAFNYNATANSDDGSCCYAGCTDILAGNYNASACADDGSCVYTQVPYNLTVFDLGDIDTVNVIDNGYGTTEHVQSVVANAIIPNVAYLQITPEAGVIIRASDFSITGAAPSGSAGGVPIFSGAYLPTEVAYVKFEDSDNQIYTNYTDPSGTDLNPAYDPNWVPTASNYVAVIVALNSIIMPYNDLDVAIDIDRTNFQPVTPVISNITLT